MAHDSTMRSHSVTQRLCLWRAVTKLLWASWVQWIHAVSMSYSQLWPRVSSLGKLFSFCHSWVGIKKKKDISNMASEEWMGDGDRWGRRRWTQLLTWWYGCHKPELINMLAISLQTHISLHLYFTHCFFPLYKQSVFKKELESQSKYICFLQGVYSWYP